MDGDKSIHVCYTFYENMERCRWTYGVLPKGWWYGGGGLIIPLLKKGHTHDETFNGPKISRNAMWYVLCKAFKELHERGIIKRYTIRNGLYFL